MAIWRILEVTILNNYFNSLKKKKKPEFEKVLTYMPPNQSLF